MSNLKKLKNESYEFYKSWKKENTFSPALDCEVHITNDGWNHINGNGHHKKRTLGDKIRRLKLLPYAKDIIKTASTIQNVMFKNGITYFAIDAIKEFKDNNGKRFKKIRVVIKEDKSGKRIFYSVMDKKVKF